MNDLSNEADVQLIPVDRITVINTATNTVLTTILAGGVDPEGLAISPDGTRLYVVNNASASVTVFNTATDTLVTTVTVGTTPVGLGNFISIGSVAIPPIIVAVPALPIPTLGEWGVLMLSGLLAGLGCLKRRRKGH